MLTENDCQYWATELESLARRLEESRLVNPISKQQVGAILSNLTLDRVIGTLNSAAKAIKQ